MSEKLVQLRNNIDQIDEQIIELLKKRLDFVHKVGEIKKQEPQKSFLKPKREASMIIELVKKAEGYYHKETIYKIWRAIITASLNAENPLNIACYIEFEIEKNDSYLLTREYFSDFVNIEIYTNINGLIEFAKKDPNNIIVIGDLAWWRYNYIIRTLNAKVFATMPFIRSRHKLNSQAYAFSNIEYEETGRDRTIIDIKFKLNRELSKPYLVDLFKEYQLDITSMSFGGEDALLHLDGYIDANNPEILQKILSFHSKDIIDIIHMGNYAAPI